MEVHELPVEDVIPTPDNKRRIDPKSPDMLELSQSIREKGVLQPVLVRPHPTKPGKWDLRAGHRRLVGSVMAGRKTIPAIIREMDDRTAAEVTTIENLQREDLSVIEEAEQLQVMIDAGWDMEACSLSIGKDPSWVHSRARISQLIPEWKECETRDGTPLVEAWSVAHLELIARYPADTQQGILAALERRWDVPSLDEVRNVIGRLTNELSKAPFSPADAELVPEAGACTSCPKRRGHHPDLFLEIGTPDLPLKDDVCLDPECWGVKERVHGETVLAKAQAKDERTVAVVKDRHYGYKKPGNDGWQSDYEPAKKTDKGAIPAVVVGGDGAVGRKTWVKPSKSYGEGGGSTRGGKKTLAEKREQLKQRRLRNANAAMWELIEKMDPPDKTLTWYAQMIAANAYDRQHEKWAFKHLSSIRESGEVGLKAALWTGLVEGLSDFPLFSPYLSSVSPALEKELTALGEELGISWPDLVAAAIEAIPEPKAWQKDGAPAKGKGAPAKKPRRAEAGICRVCGCTDMNACRGGCFWVEPDLCSKCVGKEAEAASKADKPAAGKAKKAKKTKRARGTCPDPLGHMGIAPAAGVAT